MERRNFLKQSGLTSLGLLLAPQLLLSSCRKPSLFQERNYEGKVIIIGAGAAGLYAGYLLQSKGIAFQLLEASGKAGGRLGKLEGFADYPLDLGAQWLHGKNSIIGDLIKKTKTNISIDDTDLSYWHDGSLKSALPKDLEKIFEKEDLPDISFEEYAIQEGFGEAYKYIVEAIAGDQGADASRLSAYYNIKEEENWSSGETDYKFQETFFDVFDKHLAATIQNETQLNTIVTKIDYSSETVQITDTNNNVYTADRVIVTVPITILQEGSIQFIPALPSEKTAAFQKIGMDAGMKVFMKFSSKFYDENIVGGTVCAAYADEKTGKVGEDHVLLAFIMGEQAENLTALGSDAAVVNALLQELDTMYNGQATASYLAAHVQDWTSNPFIKGAYSYAKVGIGDARSIAAKSVNDKLFFAGEAMNLNGHHQTVHGAAETGYREVINILKSAK